MHTTTSTDQIDLVSPWDPAVDIEATGLDVWTAYATREDIDVSKITIGEGAARYALHALSPREMDKVRALLPANPHPGKEEIEQLDAADRDELDQEIAAWLGELHAIVLRFALTSVDSPDWNHKRIRWMGVRCWPDAAVWSLDAMARAWLGAVAFDMATFNQKKSSPSG